ncbi:MAG: ferrous iron transport protein A [Lentisphaeria bacterium]|nr:ferrous iron transport protein A [Lentisphaeria bacterium]
MIENTCCCDSHKNDEHKLTLAELPIGTTATIVEVKPQMRGKKKFADIGIVPGMELVMEAHAPFGGLIRVKVMETSMTMHRDEAANIVMSECKG